MSKKSVGIITFHRAINYGALLQGYALQEKLNELGYDSKMVDYRSSYIESAYNLFWGLKKNKLKSWVRCFINLPYVVSKKKKFRLFAEKFLNLTPNCERSNIKNVTKDIDLFITGSDQVWNMKICGNDRTYMLDFADNNEKKASYAVSLGNYQYTEEDLDYIKLFNKISVREKCSAQYTSESLNREVDNHVDPTLLLDKKSWEKLLIKRPYDEEYIFIYSVHPQAHMIEKAREIAKDKNLKIVYLHNRVKTDIKEEGVEVIFDSSPQEFLTLIHGATYVITNSFHGTVFSIIYEKNFLSEIETKGGFNNRVWELLSALGLQRRVLEPIGYFNKNVKISEEINWSDVEQKLIELREGSVKYLKNIFD